MSRGVSLVYSRPRVSTRVAQLGRSISRDYAGRTLDVIVTLENAFIFGADLVRQIHCPAVCHFVRLETREVRMDGHDRREIFFSRHPKLEGRDVLLVDAVLHSGVLQDFLIKRLQDSRPRSLRLAVLFDKPRERKVDVKPDYFGFITASKYLVGYGLPSGQGLYRNLPYVGLLRGRLAPARSAGRPGRRKSGPRRKVR